MEAAETIQPVPAGHRRTILAIIFCGGRALDTLSASEKRHSRRSPRRINAGCICPTTSYYRWPDLELQVYARPALDICAITLLMYASGGFGSGLGMLMIAAAAGASMLTCGCSALGVTAASGLALLGAEVYADLHDSFPTTTYTQSGLLGALLFLATWLSITLACRAGQSEALSVDHLIADLGVFGPGWDQAPMHQA
jgi:hypothetical protein